ncbi:MAG TPA: hypothetical protein PLY87_07740, partial [Planctomycetaceae bacterium]|nr:hypothetical protein [Planctomycetaceae bacterium]
AVVSLPVTTVSQKSATSKSASPHGTRSGPTPMPEQRKPDFTHGHSVRRMTPTVRLKFRRGNGLLGPAYRP